LTAVLTHAISAVKLRHHYFIFSSFVIVPHPQLIPHEDFDEKDLIFRPTIEPI
jgi:hypothetical protein